MGITIIIIITKMLSKGATFLICVCSCQISSFGKLYWKSVSFEIVGLITYVI